MGHYWSEMASDEELEAPRKRWLKDVKQFYISLRGVMKACNSDSETEREDALVEFLEALERVKY